MLSLDIQQMNVKLLVSSKICLFISALQLSIATKICNNRPVLVSPSLNISTERLPRGQPDQSFIIPD